ncbi:MAG: TonB family protein [Beijerinckiaceae bacterium]
MSLVADTILPRDKDRSLALWGSAAALILAAHVALGLFILFKREPEPIGNNTPDAIMIDLTPIAAPPVEEKMEAPQPEADMAPVPEPVPEQQPLETKPILQTPELPQVLKSEVTLAVPTKPEEPKPIPIKEVPKKPSVKKPEAKAAKRPEQPERAQAQAPVAASPNSANWKSELYARLKQFQHYPEAARSRGETGTASVSFTIDRSGHVVAARLVASSGSSILDQEALATVHRASPMPAPPNGASVTISVPMRYTLR